MKIDLRDCSNSDANFVFGLIEATMKCYIIKTWGKWDNAFVWSEVTAICNTRDAKIIRIGGEDAGLVHYGRHPTHIQLEHLYIAPSHQNLGFGTRLLQDLMAEAQRGRIPLRLRVLESNPARALYERLEFIVTEATATRFFLAYQPRSMSNRPVF